MQSLAQHKKIGPSIIGPVLFGVLKLGAVNITQLKRFVDAF
jgi:hypothetical protein